MGVDAEMYVVNTGPEIDEPGIRGLAHRLCQSCGNGMFLIGRPNEWSSSPDGRHALRAATPDDLEYVKLPGVPGGQVLEVNLSGRYYGPGYERGDLRDYVWVAEILERLIPGSIIYYGGDSNPAKELFDRARREELIDHLLSVDGDNYQRGWDAALSRGSLSAHPTCDLCRVPLICNGGGSGGRTAFYWCWCGLSVETRDGGQTFRERDSRTDKPGRQWPLPPINKDGRSP